MKAWSNGEPIAVVEKESLIRVPDKTWWKPWTWRNKPTYKQDNHVEIEWWDVAPPPPPDPRIVPTASRGNYPSTQEQLVERYMKEMD